MSFKKTQNNTIGRSYLISSSFKMAVLFTILLAFSIGSWAYIIHESIIDHIEKHYIAISIGVICTALVMFISFIISIFVVKRINLISDTAASIINTKDFSRRIDTKTNWDDLSNLACILNIMFDNVEKLLDDIKNVTDNVAHDLRTPLTRLKNRLETLDQKYDCEETQQALKECNIILNIFNSLLKLNRLENGREQIKKTKTNIAILVNDAVELYEPVIEEKNLQMNVNIKELQLNIDKNLIFQSIANIIDNCCKYSDADSTININGSIENNTYKLVISDTGIGVAQKNLEKIFNRFYREESSRTQIGNGLGLSLVQEIIALHNGTIEAMCNTPKGLKITITLPLH